MATFVRKILPGLSEKLQELKTWCTNTFSLKSHNHDDRYSKTQIQTYVMWRNSVTLDDVTWIITRWSDGFVQLTGEVPDLGRQGTNAITKPLLIQTYRRWVRLPVVFRDTNYHIQITNTTWMGYFTYGGGICGYGLPLTGTTNTAYATTTGMYVDRFVLLQCLHYMSYFVRIEGYLKE